MQQKIQSHTQRIHGLLTTIEELEVGQDGLTVQISDAESVGQRLIVRSDSTASLATTASVEATLREGHETESIGSSTARTELKELLIKICGPKLGKWTIIVQDQNQVGVPKKIHLDFSAEHSDTESTGSRASTS